MVNQAEIEEEIIEALPVEDNLSAEDLLMLQEMAELGMLYGLSKSKTHPRMKPFIHSTRSGTEIIDLEKTISSLKAAGEFLKGIAASGKAILFVGTTPASRKAIKEFAEKLNYPYVTKRWLGGTLTNFKVISGRVEYFKKLVSDKESGQLSKYTKKEQLMIDRQIEKMKTIFSGIKNMKELPGALLVVDPKEHSTALREARGVGLPVAAILNTNANPGQIDYPIPANDRNQKCVAWILNFLEPYLSVSGVSGSVPVSGSAEN